MFYALPLQMETPAMAVLWNVGQGQWFTIVKGGTCWHFDSGGEFAPWREILKTCGQKQNLFTYSHWDWDHVSFMYSAAARFPQSCLKAAPAGTPKSARAILASRRFQSCPAGSTPFMEWTPAAAPSLRANDASRVVLAHGFLIPGDSTLKQERVWSLQMRDIAKTTRLVLGHHGSRTSTSERLLDQLPRLKVALVSARQARYGHPHRQVMDRLRRRKIPVLTTEQWGHIYIYLGIL